MQAGLMSQWQPIGVTDFKVHIQVPSQTVEKMIREILELHLPEIKKSLRNYSIEFVFEIVEIKHQNDDTRKIPPHIQNFQLLLSKYPEVEKLRELFGLHPTEL